MKEFDREYIGKYKDQKAYSYFDSGFLGEILVSKIRPQLVESLIIVIRTHLVKVYKNFASTLIIYKVSRRFLFLPIIFHKKNVT